MKHRNVVFAPAARDDLFRLDELITKAAGSSVALSYIERIESYCLGFDHASERGHRREDIRPNLRIIGFERRITIAFSVDETTVTIFRISTAAETGKKKCGDCVLVHSAFFLVHQSHLR